MSVKSALSCVSDAECGVRSGGAGFASIFVKLATNCVSLSFFAGLVCIGVVGISLFLKKGVTGRYWALLAVTMTLIIGVFGCYKWRYDVAQI